jgi:CheY-like chemotaxis protein
VAVKPIVLNECLEDAVVTVLPKAIAKSGSRYRSTRPAPPRRRRRLPPALRRLHHPARPRPRRERRRHRARAVETEGGRAILVTVATSGPARPGSDALPPARREEAARAVARVADIVGLHHGDCVVSTDDGRFEARVRLPLVSREAIAEPPAAASGPERAGTILIVDDDKDCLDLLSMILSRDYRTIAAKSGTRLFEVLGSGERIDLVLLDINMFDVNGIDACRRLKADPRYARLPVYMISATLGEDKKLLSLEAGASGFINRSRWRRSQVHRPRLPGRRRALGRRRPGRRIAP